MAGYPAWGELGVPFAGDRLKAIGDALGQLGGFLGLARVDSGSELAAGLVALGAGLLEAYFGIHAERKPLLSIPAKWYFHRHHLPPAGDISR